MTSNGIECKMLLPGMVQIQGSKSKTFTSLAPEPPLSASFVFDHHMLNSSQHPVMTWTKGNRGLEREYIRWKEFGRAIHRVARIVAKRLGYNLDMGEKPPKDTYVAILAAADHPTYLATAFGIIRAGCCPFPLSNNNSLAATVHLLENKKCAMLVGNALGTVPHLEKLARDALQEYRSCKFLSWIGYHHLFAPSSVDNFTPLPLPSRDIEADRKVLCFHSSGSTSFPKPIEFNDLQFFYNLYSFNYQRFDFTDRIVFLGALPCFHVMCFLFGLIGSCGTSAVYGTFEPQMPVAPVDPTSTLQVASELASYLLVTPMFLDTWARDEQSIELLKTFDVVGFGGAILASEIGNKLSSQGVKLLSVYSSTEIGGRLNHDSVFDPTFGWDYMLDSCHLCTFFRSQNDSTGYFEYLVAASDRHSPNVFNDDYNGIPVFASNDLVQLHPKNNKYFRIVGRKDDQLMLSTGEKTNPSPLIGFVERSPLVRSCLYFGRGKPHNGILVEPTEVIDVKSDQQIAQYRRSIWPFVEEANAFAPSHSRIYIEMIVIGHAKKPFERTAKGSLRSSFIVKAYGEEIEAAYTAFDQSAEVSRDVLLPSKWDIDNSILYIQSIISKTLQRDVVDLDQDIFLAHGSDSLAATRIRNSISASLEKSKAAGSSIALVRLPSDIVYRNPTIRSLALTVVNSVNGEEAATSQNNTRQRLAAMETMYDKYSRDWPKLAAAREKKSNDNDDQVVLITGTTGGLGSYTLEKLIRSRKVKTIWAVNRPHQRKSLLTRQMEAFQSRGLDTKLLEDKKIHFLDVDIQGNRLGLKEGAIYQQIASNVTVIYHLSWRLDFNLALANFEDLIKGTRNLIDLAIESSASFYFASSISVALQAKEHPIKEIPLPFEASVGLGYGESKAVVERLLQAAREERNLESCSVRFGQLSGSTANGYWATSDYIPIMIKSGITLGSLPLKEEDLSWLPIDIGADSLLDLGVEGDVRHIVQTKTVPWNDIMKQIAKTVGLKTVPAKQWVAELEKLSLTDDNTIAQSTPAIKLLSFFQYFLDQSGETRLDCTLSLEESTQLRSALPLSKHDTDLWISYWKDQKFL